MPDRVTGMSLKLQRVAARLKLREVGAEMGVSYSRVAHIERLEAVPPTAADRYRAALKAAQSKGG